MITATSTVTFTAKDDPAGTIATDTIKVTGAKELIGTFIAQEAERRATELSADNNQEVIYQVRQIVYEKAIANFGGNNG